MLAQHRDKGEFHVSATAWREYARDNTIILKNVMKGLLQEKLNIPLEVLVTINTILTIFSGLEALKEHKEIFARLVVDASALIVIVWQAYKNLPASKFPSQYIDRFNQTMISTKNLLTMKIKRNFAKRKICILADLAKLKKYKRRIDSIAVELERNANITQILREAMTDDGRCSQSRRISIPEGGVVDDGHVKQGGKQKAGARNGGAIAEHSSSPEMQKLTTIKNVVEEGEKEGNKRFWKQKNQQYDHKNSEDEEITCPEEVNLDTIVVEHPMSQGAHQSQKAKRRPSHTDNVEADECFDKEKGKKSTYTVEPEAEDDSVQGTSRQVTGLHETTQGWVASAKSLPKDKAKERTQATPSGLRSETELSISEFTFRTNGAGSIHNQNVGVIYTTE